MASHWEEKYHQLKQEYADFVYSISHDYGAPIRHIKSFYKLLSDRHADNFAGDDLTYKRFIDESLQKITAMQAVLSEYSQLERKTLCYTPYIAESLINEAIQDNGYAEHIQLEECDEFLLQCDKALFLRLLKELIDNAVKFSASGKPASIIARQAEHADIITLTNHGYQINPTKYDEAFLLFRVMHDNKDLPGIGAGLPIARKIAQIHGNMHIDLQNIDDDGFETQIVLEKT